MPPAEITAGSSQALTLPHQKTRVLSRSQQGSYSPILHLQLPFGMQQQQIHPSESTAHGDVSLTTGDMGAQSRPGRSTPWKHWLTPPLSAETSSQWLPQVHPSAPRRICPLPSPTSSPAGPQAPRVKHPRRAAEPEVPQDSPSPKSGGCHAEHSHSSDTQATPTTISLAHQVSKGFHYYLKSKISH